LIFSFYNIYLNTSLHNGGLNLIKSGFFIVNVGYFIAYDRLTCDCLSRMYQKDKYFAAISYLICQFINSFLCNLWYGDSQIFLNNGRLIQTFHLYTMFKLIKSACILAVFSFAVSPSFGLTQLHYVYTFFIIVLEFTYQNISNYIKENRSLKFESIYYANWPKVLNSVNNWAMIILMCLFTITQAWYKSTHKNDTILQVNVHDYVRITKHNAFKSNYTSWLKIMSWVFEAVCLSLTID